MSPTTPRRRRPARRPPSRLRRPGAFRGRRGSPVRDRYPAPPGERGRAAPLAVPAPAAPPEARGTAPLPPPVGEVRQSGLITLEPVFDLDQFSQQLGESTIRVRVPRENLGEVLARTSDFMGFGIYVYAIRLEPGPEEMLRSFVVELTRVEFDPAEGRWRPFRTKGRSETPFGPGAGPG